MIDTVIVQTFLGGIILSFSLFACYTLGVAAGRAAAAEEYDGPAFILYADSLGEKVLRDDESVVN